MDLAGAAREYEVALRFLPGDAELLTCLGRVQRQQGKWTEALANVEKAAALDPKTPIRWEAVYATNIWMRHYSAALRALERGIELNPNSWRCEYLRVWLFLQWKGEITGIKQLRPPPSATFTRYSYLWFITRL
jgi:tetratricopeptide (TPR) repeat protein